MAFWSPMMSMSQRISPLRHSSGRSLTGAARFWLRRASTSGKTRGQFTYSSSDRAAKRKIARLLAGQMRLIIVSRPTITGDMHGVVTTLQSTKGAQLVPVSMPLVMQPLKPDGLACSYGRIDPQHAD
jgi:hypothetical protein